LTGNGHLFLTPGGRVPAGCHVNISTICYIEIDISLCSGFTCHNIFHGWEDKGDNLLYSLLLKYDLCSFVLFTCNDTILYKSHLPQFSVQDNNYLKMHCNLLGWNFVGTGKYNGTGIVSGKISIWWKNRILLPLKGVQSETRIWTNFENQDENENFLFWTSFSLESQFITLAFSQFNKRYYLSLLCIRYFFTRGIQEGGRGVERERERQILLASWFVPALTSVYKTITLPVGNAAWSLTLKKVSGCLRKVCWDEVWT
jgi:hypothetical protein